MFSGPFAGIDRLLIDGNNLLHRVSGSVDVGAQRGLLPRLALVIPPNINTTVMLDGHAAMGSGRVQKIRNNLEVRHAGSHTADDALFNIVRDTPVGSRVARVVIAISLGPRLRTSQGKVPVSAMATSARQPCWRSTDIIKYEPKVPGGR